jgi:hypothetical protein
VRQGNAVAAIGEAASNGIHQGDLPRYPGRGGGIGGNRRWCRADGAFIGNFIGRTIVLIGIGAIVDAASGNIEAH